MSNIQRIFLSVAGGDESGIPALSLCLNSLPSRAKMDEAPLWMTTGVH